MGSVSRQFGLKNQTPKLKKVFQAPKTSAVIKGVFGACPLELLLSLKP